MAAGGITCGHVTTSGERTSARTPQCSPPTKAAFTSRRVSSALSRRIAAADSFHSNLIFLRFLLNVARVFGAEKFSLHTAKPVFCSSMSIFHCKNNEYQDQDQGNRLR